MDRLDEFNGIIEKIKGGKDVEEPLLRNRNLNKPHEMPENYEGIPEIYKFSKSFISECSLINHTLIQLMEKLHKLSQKSDPITFSITSPTTLKSDNCKEIEEALNICSLNISVMRKKLNENISKGESLKIKKSLFSSLFGGQSEDVAGSNHHPVYEHLRLVLSFLEIRVGRLTEEMETYKTRRRNRESLMSKPTPTNHTARMNTFTSTNFSTSTITGSSNNDNNNADDQVMSMLQVENTRMLEEMSRGLFETLSTTESQVLEISRLQTALQSHLTIQHDLTCRLFDDSVTTVDDTVKGNEYLRRSGKDGSLMRKFLVAMILGMSLLLLLLHYFNK